MTKSNGWTTIWSSEPEAWARLITKRPGMFLGSASFERAVGFVHGLQHLLLMRCRTQEDLDALPTSRHAELLRREDGQDDHEAIRRLEPLLIELFANMAAS